MIRLMLPQNHECRNKIVKVCSQIFECTHGSQIVSERYANKKRQNIMASPAMDKSLFPKRESIYACPAELELEDVLAGVIIEYEQFHQ